MWVNEISIDKKYLKEYDYIVTSVDKIKNLSYSKENTKSRFVCTIATSEYNVKYVKTCLAEMLKKLVLVLIKKRYIFGEFEPSTYGEVAIIGSILHFDSLYEETYLVQQMQGVTDYNIDGIFNFRLQKLKENWNELKRLSLELLMYSSECDLTYVASLMNSSTAERVSEVELKESDGKYHIKTNVSDFSIFNIYPNKYYNLLDSLIFLNPHKILISTKLPKDLLCLIKKIMQVKDN